MQPRGFTRLFLSCLTFGLCAGVFGGARSAEAAWGVLSDVHGYQECFGLDPQQSNYPNSGRMCGMPHVRASPYKGLTALNKTWLLVPRLPG